MYLKRQAFTKQGADTSSSSLSSLSIMLLWTFASLLLFTCPVCAFSSIDTPTTKAGSSYHATTTTTSSSSAIIAGDTAFPVEHYIINLDLPPEKRWVEVITKYKYLCNQTIQTLIQFIPRAIRQEVIEAVEIIGSDVEGYLGPLGKEIAGLAAYSGIPVGEVVFMNIFYELVALCTSIVAQREDGQMLHARNLDFGFGGTFTAQLQNLTIQVEFQKGGKTLYYASTYAGYVGVLTGMAPGRFSVSINERLSWDILGNLVEVLTNPNASVISFLVRETLENSEKFPNYEAALELFSTHPLIADCYIIVAGVGAGQGAVITRARPAAVDVWKVDSDAGRWFLLETNYDHWHSPPFWDDRRDPGNKGMNTMGRHNLTLPGMLNVLTIKPVLNEKTTYTTLMAASNGTFLTYRRICPQPCPY